MATLRIPAFLELTPIDWLAATGRSGSTRTALDDELDPAGYGAGAASAAAPGSDARIDADTGAAADRGDSPDAGTPRAGAHRAAESAPTLPDALQAAPAGPDAASIAVPAPDASPVLQLRRRPDGRMAFALLSKVGATLVAGESATACSDPQTFARRVLEACTGTGPLRLVDSPQGPRLALGGDAEGLRAHSRPATGAAHAEALRRLIAIQAAGASIRIDRD